MSEQESTTPSYSAPEPSNCPNFDIDDAIKLFGAYLEECVDGGLRSTPIDNYLAAVYQITGLIRLNNGPVTFHEGKGSNTSSARAMHQLAKAGLADTDVVTNGSDVKFKTFTINDWGRKIVSWMIEGKREE